MFPPIHVLRQQLAILIRDRQEQGRDVTGLAADLAATPDDYQALYLLARRIDATRQRPDWPYREPSDYASIAREQSLVPSQPTGLPPAAELAGRARAGFLGSVAGCILGKPVEIMPTMYELRDALQAIGEWPLDDYIPEAIRDRGGLRALHPDHPESVRENIRWVTPDDDINYTLLGMMTLERYGPRFTKADLRTMWLTNLPLGFTWGPERGFLTRQGMIMGVDDDVEVDLDALPASLNPNSELCGAMIRADAFGYASPGDPVAAAEMAWRDASMTHQGNGIYGAMFAAAAIAVAFVESDWQAICETALAVVPQRSRLAEIVRDSIGHVAAAQDWVEGYERIHGRYGHYGHCRIFQETGTLVNTLKFARSVGHGICLQVSQGNDTDSYGATAGAILGVRFGPGHLDERWLRPFRDTIHTRLAGYYELSLDATADRVGRLAATRLPLQPV